jgi:2Fe-2S ferredoxin
MDVVFRVEGEDLTVALNPGDRLLKGAYKLGLDAAGFGECGGNCVCSTCHVHVEEGADAFDAPTPEEEQMLDSVFNLKPNSRLACQLVLTPDHERVVVAVPGKDR